MNQATGSSSPERERTAIRLIGVALIAVGVLSAALLFLWSGSPFALTRLERDASFLPLYIIGPAVVLYVLTGIGLICLTKWGYVLLKCVLYILFLAFPVGTIIAYQALSYLHSHRVKRQFGFATTASRAAAADRRWFKVASLVLAAALALAFAWMMLTF